MVSLDVCGINITCSSYFSNTNNPTKNLTGIKFINTWSIYLSKGENIINITDSVEYDKGTLVYLKLVDAVIAVDSSFGKSVKDYQKIGNNLNDSFDLIDLNTTNKYTFCVKIIAKSYSFKDAKSFVKALNYTGSNILIILFYNVENNYYYNKTFNIFGKGFYIYFELSLIYLTFSILVVENLCFKFISK